MKIRLLSHLEGADAPSPPFRAYSPGDLFLLEGAVLLKLKPRPPEFLQSPYNAVDIETGDQLAVDGETPCQLL